MHDLVRTICELNVNGRRLVCYAVKPLRTALSHVKADIEVTAYKTMPNAGHRTRTISVSVRPTKIRVVLLSSFKSTCPSERGDSQRNLNNSRKVMNERHSKGRCAFRGDSQRDE